MLFLMLLLLISVTESCEEKKGCTYYGACNYDANADVDDGSCEYTSCNNTNPANEGALIFWTNTSAYGMITVNCNSSQRTITSYNAAEPPCLSAYGAYYYLPVGSYNYTATSQGGMSWNGSVTVQDGCNRIALF